MRLIIIICFISFFNGEILLAQGISKIAPWEEKYKNAEKICNEGNYSKALSLYKELLIKDTSNANLNYKVGFCLMHIPLKKSEAITYLLKAIIDIAEENKYNPSSAESKKAPFETPILLAEAYMLNYEFDKCLEFLDEFQSLVSANNDKLKKNINKLKDQCNFGKETVAVPSNMKTTLLEAPINSTFADFNPLVSSDESVMIFASRRNGSKVKTGNKGDPGQANIYISHKKGNTWGIPEKMSATINSFGDNIPVGLSADGKQLYICKIDNGNMNLFQSTFNGKSWSQPVKLNANINSKFDEANVSVSSDGNLLYFTSNRSGGYGGFDIYMSKKLPNGEWGEALNMGSAVNTEYDEASPYIHPDGYTFFFASKGHHTIGGYDLFFCAANDDNSWGEPINLGYPVNTTEDDLYYTPIADGKKAYYASFHSDGLGESDIFHISIINTSKSQTIANGYIKLENTNNAENIEITLTDNETKEVIGRYVPNPKTGKFLVVLLPRKNHVIFCEATGYFPYINNLILSRKSSYQETATTINLDTITLSKTYQTYSFEFLDVDTAVSPKAETRLALMTNYLKSSSAIAEIIGNKAKLSENRVLFLKNYLLRSGLALNRIQVNYSDQNKSDIINFVVFDKQNEKYVEELLIKKNYIRKLK